MLSKNIFFILFTVLIFAQNINAMHCKNTKLLRLISQDNKTKSSQQKKNVLRLYGQDLSIPNPIFIPKKRSSISKDETVNLYPLCVGVVFAVGYGWVLSGGMDNEVNGGRTTDFA